MNRPAFLLLLLCLLAVFAWWALWQPEPPAATVRAAVPVVPVEVATQAPAVEAAVLAEPQAKPVAGPSSNKTGPRYKRAYMLSIDKGAVSLVQAQDIEGDFAPRRGEQEVWSTMLRVKLVSANDSVLAEEVMPAPDQVCHVLDPRAGGKPVDYSPVGPIVFQARLPRVRGASRMDIFRIMDPGPPVVEKLISSVTLPSS